MKNSLSTLRNVSRIQQQQLQQITKENNLTISEWQLLLCINDGYETQEHLSKQMSLDTSTLSRQLKRLTEKKMVDKEAIGKDKRQLIYQVNEQGSLSLVNIKDDYDKLKERIFEQWTDEEKNMLKILLNRLETSMNKINK